MVPFVSGEGFNDLQSYIYIGSKLTRSSARFTLVNLDTTMLKDQLMVKEKISSSLPPKKSTTDLTVKTPGSRKRKSVESAGLSLESLGAMKRS